MTEFLESRRPRARASGRSYALLALGFVIIYKSTGVISFAQPALMLAGAVLVSYLRRRSARASTSRAAALAGRAGLAALGLVVERTAIRPMVGRAGVRRRDHHDRHRHRDPGRGQRLHRARRPRQVGDPWGLDRVDVARAARCSSGTSR